MDDHQYRGALALKFKTFGLSAFAILDTQLPGGGDGFSFVASIFGEFVLPLGQGFFLTGVGGVIGINRTTDTDALKDVLFGGGDFLFPAAPIQDANTILNNMAAIFPVQAGRHLFGPMARIEFGRPALIVGKIGLILEVDSDCQPQRLVLLGMFAAQLPNKNTALVDLRLAFVGVVNFAAGTLTLDASLQGSRILSFPVSGDVAVRTGWSGNRDQVFVFGGMHPLASRPASLPAQMNKMSIAFGGNNPRITFSAYHAITLNSLQFGAEASLYAQASIGIGTVTAEGSASFDALIYFRPFSFDVSMHAGLVLRCGKFDVSASANLHLTGPNRFVVDGDVSAKLCGANVSVPFHAAWGTAQSEPAVLADPRTALDAALRERATIEPTLAAGLSEGIVFARRPASEAHPPLSPVGGLKVIQRALPLGVEIEKIGEADATGASKVDIAVFSEGVRIHPAAVKADFVHGHFWRMSDGEKLAAPAFESYKAGFEITPDVSLIVDDGKAQTATGDYEIIQITNLNIGGPTSVTGLSPNVDIFRDLIRNYQVDLTASETSLGAPAVDAIGVDAAPYVPTAPDLTAADGAVVETHLGHAAFGQMLREARDFGELRPANPAVSGHVVQ